MTDEPEQLPPLRRVTSLRTGELFWQRSWEFERLRAEFLYAPMNGTLRSWIKRRWFNVSWRWNRDPWVRWSAALLARKPESHGRNGQETTKEESE
jgi:hypothetical protein